MSAWKVPTENDNEITLELRAVVEPYRDPLVRDGSTVRVGYRRRARSLLDSLHHAALPFPDQADLSAARVELDLT